jgi:hypothetical protein
MNPKPVEQARTRELALPLSALRRARQRAEGWSPKPVEQARTRELALALPALRRARQRAEEIAIATNTCIV